MPEPDPDRIVTFSTPASFNRWLKKNHATWPELWMRMYKKASGIETIVWDEAVTEALCWGWIDGIRKSYCEISFVQRFTPRRPRSNWSKRNCETVERLIREGRMEAPGLATVEAAKADGRWDNAYDSPGKMEVPADFLAALAKSPRALAFFESLNRQNHYAIAYHLQTAKRAETRQRRFEKYLEMMKRGEKLH